MAGDLAQDKKETTTTFVVVVFQCAEEDSNLHGMLLPPAPQAGASANSATSARGSLYSNIAEVCLLP